MTAHQEPGWVVLLAQILRDTPRLDGAACRGRHVLFDPAEHGSDADAEKYRNEAALALCESCPALDACRQFAAKQPKLCGVIAGQIHYHQADSKRSA